LVVLVRFVLGDTLEGFNVKLSPERNQTYKMIAARKNEEDYAAGLYERYVFGGMAEYVHYNDKEIPVFDIGLQAVTVQDDRGTLDGAAAASDINNTVLSLDGKINPIKNFKILYEIAQSFYRNDEQNTTEDMNYGTAFRVLPELVIKGFKFKYLYYLVTPHFYTAVGSAMPDKEQHQFSVDWEVMKGLTLSFTENYYWDHLKGSIQDKKTVNDEKYISAYIRPIKNRPTLTIRPYVNLLARDSDDTGNSVESETNTYGIALNDSIADWRVNYGISYEYREFIDLGNERASSDIYNRVTFNFGWDTELFGRPLYLSDDVTVDFRATKSDDDPDISASNSLSLIYDFHDMCSLRVANNVQEIDGAAPGTNLTSTTNYAELIFTIDRERSLRWIVRAEKNRYRHEDGTQSYDEDRLVTKISSSF